MLENILFKYSHGLKFNEHYNQMENAKNYEICFSQKRTNVDFREILL